ncbi:MAG: hypothetical protein RR135_04710 [Oscillospiraceae bacterium]
MEQKDCIDGIMCCKCDCPLVMGTIVFGYMGFTFNRELPHCPKCGQVYISEDLVNGRMLDVEMELEDK